MISKWAEMIKGEKNSLHGSLTFLIKKRELIMTKKWLSPFWNWETKVNHGKRLLLLILFNSGTQTPISYHFYHFLCLKRIWLVQPGAWVLVWKCLICLNHFIRTQYLSSFQNGQNELSIIIIFESRIKCVKCC